MKKTLNIGIAGLGTVGMGVVKILSSQAELLTKRSGKRIKIQAVSARDRHKDRGAGLMLEGVNWYTNPVELAMDADVDVVVEAIGGDSGPAYELCERALKDGKHVVTANKALIAHHGEYLAGLAEENNVTLAFEAAVAGGVPVVKALKEGLAGNKITRVLGIMNGTCNYMLTVMQETGRNFDDILKDAQELGYAEADPSFDVDGIDTAHKLAILTSIAFGAPVYFDKTVHVQGIRSISPLDVQYAQELGYKIKLLGIASSGSKGIRQYVYPAMVPLKHPLAQVDGVENAVFIEGDAVNKIMLRGPGAGGGPTASSVVADVMDIASGRASKAFGMPVSAQERQHFCSINHHKGPYYIRVDVKDKPGVLADITDIFRDEKVSMDALLQKAVQNKNNVHIVGITHDTAERKMIKIVEKIKKVSNVVHAPQLLRVQTL